MEFSLSFSENAIYCPPKSKDKSGEETSRPTAGGLRINNFIN